jgi:hypothetical protein
MLARLALIVLAAVSVADDRPGPRFLSMAAYDGSRRVVLLYGGAAGGDVILDDLWALDGAAWTKLAAAGPGGRVKAAFAYDANRKRAVLFGGSGSDPLMGDTWEWDGRAWARMPVAGPSPRNHPMAAYDGASKAILLFGGFAGELLCDTWSYDGRAWTRKDTDGPKSVLAHGMFFDQRRGRVVMITMAQGARDASGPRSRNAVWEWTGERWRALEPPGPLTSPSSLQALAPSPDGGIVLFDGDDARGPHGRTWTFTGGAWASAWLEGPSLRIGHAMAYDPAHRRTILFGGSDRRAQFGDLWSWDGAGWHRVGGS